MKSLLILFLVTQHLIANQKESKLWEVVVKVHPAIIIDGKVSRGKKANLLLISEQGNEHRIVQKFVNVDVDLVNNIWFVNSAFDLVSKHLISDIKDKKRIVLDNVYVRGGSDEKLTIMTVPIDEISGRQHALVLSRRIIGGLDIFVLEAVLTNRQAAELDLGIPNK